MRSSPSPPNENPQQPTGAFFSMQRQAANISALPLRGIHINISSDPFQHRIPPHLQHAWQESRIRKRVAALWDRFSMRYRASTMIELFGLLIVIAIAGLVLLVHVGFFSGKKYQDWHNEHTGFLDEVDLLEKLYPDDGRWQTTGIILFHPSESWTIVADANYMVVPIIERLCQYDMFRSFVIWNNNPRVNVSMEGIRVQGCPQSKISVYNSPCNMHTAGRYLACSQAKTPYCYFQDHVGSIRHLRSLYANFLLSPDLVHSESLDTDAYVRSQWSRCFFNDDIRMHTCHAYIGSGTLVSKENAARYVNLVSYDPVDVAFSDIYFTMYMNQVPYQLEGTWSPLKVEESTEMKHHMHYGAVSIYNHLKHETGFFNTEQIRPSSKERHARTPCHNDNCLFLTNVDAFPDQRAFSYDPNIKANETERLHNDYFDAESHFMLHPYSHAVDGNDKTAWMSVQDIRAGDYIGFDLLMMMRVELKYRLLVRHPLTYRRSLSFQTSHDGVSWVPLHPTPGFVCEEVNEQAHEPVPLLDCSLTVTETGYRFIRLLTTKDMNFGFTVYDFSFSARMKRDIDGHMLENGADDQNLLLLEVHN